MPTYGYRCEHCQHEFELFQSITARPVRKCPECGRLKVKRLLGTGAGVIFKGSGFYQTDYRSDSYKKAADKDKPTKEKGEKKESSKTDTKTTTVSQPKPESDKSTKKKTA
jgi:putative FmdB family regulatory protein